MPKTSPTLCWPLKLLALFILSACGRELHLEPRQTLNANDLTQTYRVTVFASSSIASYYQVEAIFSVPVEGGDKNLKLPEGDTVQLNGETLDYAIETSSYTATGRGNPEGFLFAWNHAGTVYQNGIMAQLYPPQAVPLKISKASPQALTVNGTPAGMSLAASLNAGLQVEPPFFSFPLTITGSGQAASAGVDMSGLAVGPGVLTLLEKTSSALQDPTDGGGSMTSTIQFGYNVTITE